MMPTRLTILFLCLTAAQLATAPLLAGDRLSFERHGQSHEVDSLIALAKAALAEERYDVCFNHAQQAMDISALYDDIAGKTQGLRLMARACQMKGLQGSALKYYLRALKDLEVEGEKMALAEIYLELGDFYEDWGVKSKALEFFMSAYNARGGLVSGLPGQTGLAHTIAGSYLEQNSYDNALLFYQYLIEHYTEKKDTTGLLAVTDTVAGINLKLGRYRDALTNKQTSLKINYALGDSSGIFNDINEIGYAYKHLRNFEASFAYFQKYLDYTEPYIGAQDGPYKEKYIETLITLGSMCEELTNMGLMKSYGQALGYLAMALRIHQDDRDPARTAKISNLMSRIHLKERDYGNARFFSEMAIDQANKSHTLLEISQAYLNISNLYKQKRKYKPALKFHTLFNVYHDSLMMDKIQEKNDMLRKEEADRKKHFIINKTEQMVLDEEFDSLNYTRIRLEAEKRGQELQILRADRELQGFALANEQLMREKAIQALLLAQEQLENSFRNNKILILESDKRLHEMQLRHLALEEKERLNTIRLLEKDKALSDLMLSKEQTLGHLYAGIIVLITLILLLSLNSYRLAKRANRKLALQNTHIEKQSAHLKSANEALKELNKEKSHLVSIVAHDLRNPLAVAMNLTAFLKRKAENLSSEQLESIDITHRSLRRMNEMVVKILDLRAIESNHVNISIEPVDVGSTLRLAVSNYREEASKKNICLETHIPETGAMAQADANYLLQVFENLVSNALKFSYPGQRVWASVSTHGGQVYAEVCDQGPGIAPGDMPKMFGKYQKLTARPTGGEQSMGIGLSIVKKYVEAMNGKVWCNSEPGRGAVFTVAFPQQEAPAPEKTHFSLEPKGAA